MERPEPWFLRSTDISSETKHNRVSYPSAGPRAAGSEAARTGDLGQVVLPEREAPGPVAAVGTRAAQRTPRLLGVGEGAEGPAARGQQHAVCGAEH